jgi:fucose permease
MAIDATAESNIPLSRYLRFSFVVIGMITVLLGQVLPFLSLRINLTDAEAGTLFLAQFSGSILGTILTGSIVRRRGFVFAMLLGIVLLMIGLPGLETKIFAVCWAAIFIYGIGLGITIPAANLLTIEITPLKTQASAVNYLNFSWGIGAIFSQPVASFFGSASSLLPLIVLLWILLVSVGLLTYFAGASTVSGVEQTVTEYDEGHVLWRQPKAWLFALFSFFVVGIEGGLGGWLTSYSEALQGKGGLAVNATVVFFTFFVIGRGLAGLVSRRISIDTVLFVCSATMLGGIVLLILDAAPVVALIGAALAGLGGSAVFPTNMVRFTNTFGAGATRHATPVFICGTLGAAITSSLIGLISTHFNSLRIGIYVVMFFAFAVFVLQFALRGRNNRKRSGIE